MVLVLREMSSPGLGEHDNCKKSGAPPGIEPGPLAPKARILPLNYRAAPIQSNLDIKNSTTTSELNVVSYLSVYKP